jgi:hypothetical protein
MLRLDIAHLLLVLSAVASIPGFLIIAASSNTSSSRPKATLASAGVARASVTVPSNVEVGFSSCAKAGIGIGVALEVVEIGALIAVLFLLRCRRECRRTCPGKESSGPPAG